MDPRRPSCGSVIYWRINYARNSIRWMVYKNIVPFSIAYRKSFFHGFPDVVRHVLMKRVYFVAIEFSGEMEVVWSAKNALGFRGWSNVVCHFWTSFRNHYWWYFYDFSECSFEVFIPIEDCFSQSSTSIISSSFWSTPVFAPTYFCCLLSSSEIFRYFLRHVLIGTLVSNNKVLLQ